MTKRKIADMTSDELVDRFEAISLEQSRIVEAGSIAKYNRLFDQLVAIRGELERRGKDDLLALLRLLQHRDLQVRLVSAQFIRDVAPGPARRALQSVAEISWSVESFDARMSLRRMGANED